jgi:tRNA G37 N-methylase TrmD
MSRKHSTGYKVAEDYILKGKPLNETFLIESLYRYASQVLSNPEAVKEQLKGIDSDSWINCAKDALAVMDKHFQKV